MFKQHARAVKAAAAATALSLLTAGLAAPAGAATGQLVDPGTSARVTDIAVYSPSMNSNIPLTVIKPKDASKPRGVLYLLNGAGGGEDAANWTNKSDIVKFTQDKNLYVVIPNKGAFSYYTDWEKPDEKLGVNKWSTFLGKELPPVIDGFFNTNGRNAIGGISSSATSVLNLAIEHRGLYRAVGAYSGCAQTSDTVGMTSVRLVVEARGGGDATNMWGPYKGKGWPANDPVVNAHKLRGTQIYLSTASGLPGRYDNLHYVPDPGMLGDQMAVGGFLEAGSLYCTQNLANRLRELKIPATVDVEPAGSHSWKYWQDQLHRSWGFYERALR